MRIFFAKGKKVRRSSRKTALGFANCEVSSKVIFSVTLAVFEKIPTESTPTDMDSNRDIH